MNRTCKTLISGCLVVVGAAFSLSAHAQWVNYDVFRGSLMNPKKWDALEPGADGRWLQEVERYVSGGALNLSLRSHSEPDTDSGQNKVRNRMFIPAAKQVGLVAMRMDVVIKKTKAKGCTANDDPTSVRFLMENTYFNSGGSSGTGDATGDIYTYIEARVTDSSPRQNPVEILARAVRCENSSCSTTTTLASKSLVNTSRNKTIRLQSLWNENSSKIKWSVAVSDGTKGSGSYNYANDGIAVAGPPAKRDVTNGFQLRTEVANCDATVQTKRPQGRIQATVDNVQVKKI